MRVVLFCHSLLSDWNHGNAHFLRGVVTELAARGHDVRVYEPANAWSVENLLRDHGESVLGLVCAVYPAVRPRRYRGELDLDEALDGADLVLVHEWTEPALVARIGRARTRGVLLFHDTHHRMATEPDAMARYDLSRFDGVLAFGGAIRDQYERRGWARRTWVWHEAADTRVFRPLPGVRRESDIVWIGNWGDEERTTELATFFLEPVRDLGLSALVHGVRYPATARMALHAHRIEYRGWLPNFRVPEVFARHRVTVHVPRRPYVEALPGIPTIRVFEALACGIPLVSAPWDDIEGLFSPGADFLVARDGDEMKKHLRLLVGEPAAARAIAEHGLATILRLHTCAHRVDELLAIVRSIHPRPSHLTEDMTA